jgi:homoserine dehydrogenase
MPTASAVIADVIALARGPDSRRCRWLSEWTGRKLPIVSIEDIESRYYIRITALDEPGVMAKVSGVLGRKDISLSAILQHESEPAKPVPVIIMTHLAREGSVREALAEIAQLEVVSEPPVCIRVAEESA